jgi:penicillin-binding protein 1C
MRIAPTEWRSFFLMFGRGLRRSLAQTVGAMARVTAAPFRRAAAWRARLRPFRLSLRLGPRALACFAAGLAFCLWAIFALKLLEPLPLDRAVAASQIVTDRDGLLLRAFTTPEGRWRLDADQATVSPHYLKILFAFEDRRFFDHPGIDPLALGRAVWQSLREGRITSGGSTLTMQVARLLRGSPTHSLPAKFQQFADALRLEWTLSKHEILNLYLKNAPFVGNI